MWNHIVYSGCCITVEILCCRLSLGATTFGRGADSDVCIDSMVLLNFISRSHAKVIGTRGINGQIEFTLHDTSLNGTYVNDIRVRI